MASGLQYGRLCNVFAFKKKLSDIKKAKDQSCGKAKKAQYISVQYINTSQSINKFTMENTKKKPWQYCVSMACLNAQMGKGACI